MKTRNVVIFSAMAICFANVLMAFMNSNHHSVLGWLSAICFAISSLDV